METEEDSQILTGSAVLAPNPALTPDAVLDRMVKNDAGGETLATVAAPRFALPLIALLGGLLFVLNLGGYPLYTKGEPREAVTVFDVVHGGGVILPMRAGVELPSKPLLMHWLAAVVAIVAGEVNEWTVRLPSALCAIGAMLACYLYVRRLYDERAGLVAALILSTTFQFLQAARGARVDMTLTFLLQLAFFEFILIAEQLSQRTTLFYLAIAFAVLTKGPIGIALPAMVAGAWTVLYRRWELFRRLDLKRGALIVGIIGGGWYLAATIAGGSAFIHKQLLAENLYRLMPQGAGYVGHHHPFYYEEAALIGGFMPWTPITGLAGLQLFRGSRPIDRRFGYLLLWFVLVLVFYNLPQSKRGVYLLALYPALSTLVAVLLVDMLDTGRSSGASVVILSWLTGLVFAAGGALVLSGLAIQYLWPTAMVWLLRHFGIAVPELTAQLGAAVRARPLIGPLLSVALASVGISLMRFESSLARLVACTAAGCVLITLAVNLVVEPAVARSLSLKQFAAETRRIADGAPVGYFGNLDYGFAFYNGRDLQLTTPLDPAGPPLLVSPEEDWRLVAPRLSDNYAVVLRSHPTDLDGSGRMLLLRRRSPAAPATGKITT